jgi:DNA-binding NtrC family response regulator
MTTTTNPLILVIDDCEEITRFCQRVLGDAFGFRHVTDGLAAKRLLDAEPIAAILLDRDFSHADPARLLGPSDDIRNEGLHILRWLRREHADLPVLMVTGLRDLPVALQAADLGADFLAWEDVIADPGVLQARLSRALEFRVGQQEDVLARFREFGIVVESPAFARALTSLYRAIPGNAPILLLGETGTGKDSLACAIHALSGDPLRPCVTVNVASLNPNIIESELFGHARGAFTGADKASIGKLRYAHGGTLFLNEVGDLAPEIQVKLLTVLERSEVVPVGDVKSYPAEFRLITATSRDLRSLVASGRFRRDLFHRIAWHMIEIPPLRERQEDIPALVHTFLRATTPHREGTVLGIAREALQYLSGLPWVGNVRELRGAVEAAAAGARHMITVGDVREIMRRHESLFAPHLDVPAPAAARLERSAALLAATAGEPAVSAPLATAHDRADCEAAVFGSLGYRDLTAAFYRYLVRKAAGRLPEVARLAGISKATVYEWRDRYEDRGTKALPDHPDLPGH